MTKRTDIVLIRPGSRKRLYGSLADAGLTALEPPLWAALLAGYLRGLGYSVVLLDAEAEGWNCAETARRIADTEPLLAAVVVSGTNPSASTMNMAGAGETVSSLARSAPGTRRLLWGLHPSALPERTLLEEDVDFVCQGEGFVTLPLLIDALRSGSEKFQIPGLWYREEGRAAGGPRAPLLDDLDILPAPAWDLLPMYRYRAHNWHCLDRLEARQPYGVLYTSLGCPFGCAFCCVNALFGRKTIRYRSLERVLDDLDLLATGYGIRNIKIMDEMFALDEGRTAALCEMIASRRYELNMWAYARVNTVTPMMLEKMKKAGINWVAYGFESGSERVLKSVAKNFRVDQVAKIVELTRSLDINICSNFIFGLPEDDNESMRETLELMLDINAEWANIYCAMAYPGSRLYERAREEGWPLPGSWEGYSQYAADTLPLPTRYLDGGQVLAFRDHAFHAYYTNPRYLESIARKFGSQALAHIREMAGRTLERNRGNGK